MRAPVRSTRLRLLFLLLAVLSVGGKVLAGDQSLRGAEQALQSAGKDQLADFLGRQGFQVHEEGRPDSPFVQAATADCHLLVMLAAPEGWHRDIIRRLALPQDQVFFVFDAVVYQDQPEWLPWAHHYWRVLNFYIGRKLPARPLLGIVASPACDLRDMPWREITALPSSRHPADMGDQGTAAPE
ncbi:MAG: hypothetical protein QJR07_15530 [Acetobacteraceae bacterium]|nr:hypothetical protein [Acetobacteraceae bacterium]MDI3308503.1 hypothetical protein [Acetobacteraceae bacterium]